MYQKLLQYCLLLQDNKVIVLEVLQNDVKYLFQRKNFKKRISQYFLAEKKSLCFLLSCKNKTYCS